MSSHLALDTARRKSDKEAGQDPRPLVPTGALLEEALLLGEQGDFRKAAQKLRACHTADSLRELYAALSAHIADNLAPTHATIVRLRAALDTIRAVHGAKTVFSTFKATETPADVTELREAFETEGNGRVTITLRSQVLEAVVRQWAKLRLRQSLPAEGLFIHILLHFTSNVGDNLYLTLTGPQHEEVFRFSNVGFTACNHNYVRPKPMNVPTLVSIALTPTHVSVFLNGNLEMRKKCIHSGALEHLEFELKGHESADLGAQILGFDVWSSPTATFETFLDPAEDVASQLFEHRLNTLDANKLYATFISIDDVAGNACHGRAAALLDKLLEARPYRPEMLDLILESMPRHQADAWLANNKNKLPERIMGVRDLTVQFFREPNRVLALGRIVRRRALGYFNVLDDVNFEVYDGDTLGIIGENGAGKSTLLRTLAGLIPIKRGEIFIQGKPVLLRQGVGFREEMTGRENIFLAGAYLALDPRMMARVADEIIDFAELRDAIDRPFKYYSDGMKARLMFALATSINPEILMLDEPLGAGDARFRDKAVNRMEEVMQKAKCVVIVTHGVEMVRLKCTRALYLVRGKQRYYGDPGVAVNYYLNDLHLSGSRADA